MTQSSLYYTQKWSYVKTKCKKDKIKLVQRIWYGVFAIMLKDFEEGNSIFFFCIENKMLPNLRGQMKVWENFKHFRHLNRKLKKNFDGRK